MLTTQTSSVVAQDIELRYVPPYTSVVHDGTELACYDLEDFLAILKLDIDLQETESQLENTQKLLDLSEDNFKKQVIITNAAREQYNLVKEDHARLLKKWKTENKKRHEAEAPSFWEVTLPYAVIILGTIAVTEGVIIYYTAD